MPFYTADIAPKLLPTNAAPVNSAWFEIRVGPTNMPVVTTIGCIQIGGGTSGRSVSFGIGIPAAQGVTPRIPQGLTAFDPNSPAADLAIYTDWVTPPTTPTNYFRRATFLGVSNGGGSNEFQFRFPRGLRLAPSSSLAFWAITANGTSYALSANVFVEVDG
jgi:hypothetical protein